MTKTHILIHVFSGQSGEKRYTERNRQRNSQVFKLPACATPVTRFPPTDMHLQSSTIVPVYVAKLIYYIMNN